MKKLTEAQKKRISEELRKTGSMPHRIAEKIIALWEKKQKKNDRK